MWELLASPTTIVAMLGLFAGLAVSYWRHLSQEKTYQRDRQAQTERILKLTHELRKLQEKEAATVDKPDSKNPVDTFTGIRGLTGGSDPGTAERLADKAFERDRSRDTFNTTEDEQRLQDFLIEEAELDDSLFEDSAVDGATLEDEQAADFAGSPHPDDTPLEYISDEPGAKPPEDPDLGYKTQMVYFGTDRAVKHEEADLVTFGHVRNRALTFGIAEITIPDIDRFTRIPRPKRKLSKFFGREQEDPKKHFTIATCKRVGEQVLVEHAGATLNLAEIYKNTALVFVHGFNTTFEDALFRTAQIAVDINFDGPAFTYSWPAVGGAAGFLQYATDMESAQFAAPYLDEFVATILTLPGIEQVHMIAHSMGNQLLAQWMQEVNLTLQKRNAKTLAQMVLAAPDIDRALFEKVAPHLVNHSGGVTLYACSTDIALNKSSKLRNNLMRAGDVPEDGLPVIHDQVDTIDISAVGRHWTDIRKYTSGKPFLDHSMFADDPLVISDLGSLLVSGTRPPHTRTPTLRYSSKVPTRYWYIPRQN